MARWWVTLQDRLVSSDPGLTRLRLGIIALGNLALTITVLSVLDAPLPAVIVGSVVGMQATFLVTDDTEAGQAVTLLLILVLGCVVISAATLASGYPVLPEAMFLLVIFLAVYAQRFGPRGTALGAAAFFLNFFSIFLNFTLSTLPVAAGAIALGLAGNALMRFVVLPRRPAAELLRVRRAFRARVARLIAAIARALEEGASQRQRRQMRRLITRLHECGLMIEEVLTQDADPDTELMLRRRVVEVELAAERLLRVARQTDTTELTKRDRVALVDRLHQLHGLIERDPAELPVISNTAEFSDLLASEPDADHPERAWPLGQAIGQLAVADAEAQRLVERELAERPPVAVPLSSSRDPDDRDPDNKDPDKPFLDEKARQALQALVGGALAIVGGELVSPQRWYWAVITVFVVFVGTSSRGTMFVKGFRRLTGTVWGIAGGLGAASLVGASAPAAVALIGICVFSLVYVARVSQGLMAFFMTTMLGLLYSLLGTFSFDVLLLRLSETAVGVAAGMLAALVIVPIRTREAITDQVATTLTVLRDFVEHARDLLSGTENVNLIEHSRELDQEIDTLRSTVEPLTHPFNLYRGRREYGWYIQAALETCAFCARDLAVRAEPALLTGDERLEQAAERLVGNLDRVLAAVRDEETAELDEPAGVLSTPDDPPGIRVALDSLARLDSSVFSLGRALDLITMGRIEPDGSASGAG